MAERYRRAKIALLTGWTLEYIDSLGLIDQEDLLESYEAEQAIRAPKKGKGKR